MNIKELKTDLSIRVKNGLPFILAAVIIWAIFLIIHLLPLKIVGKNLLSLYSTGLMFPIAILLSKVIKADWKTNDNPIGSLGLYLNLAQIMYFPLLFWAFSKHPDYMIIFFAVITGAHFFPYGWFYDTKVYFVMAPIISISITFLGWNINQSNLWQVPAAMVGLLIILIILLFLDYRSKLKLFAG